MSRRKIHAAPMSLFAFQDVLMSVIGIMLLVVMLLAMQITTDSLPPSSETSYFDDTVNQLHERMRGAQARLYEANSLTSTLTTSELLDRVSIKRGEVDALYIQISDREQELQTRFAALESSTGVIDAVRKTLEDAMDAEVRLLQARQELETEQRNRRLLYVMDSRYPKRALIVELSESGWRLGGAEQHSTAITLSHARHNDREAGLRRWLGNFPVETHYVLLLVKPSGQAMLENVEAFCRQLGYGIGIDLLPERSSALIGGYR